MEENGFFYGLWLQLMALPVIGVLLMGAMGGATNGLVVRVSYSQMVRYVILGAFCAAGSGQLSGALLERVGLFPEGVTQGASGAVAFFAGLFFPALFEVILSRLKAGKLPMDDEK